MEGISPGTYRLTYSPACNPLGCTGPADMRVVDQDAFAGFYRSECVADCSANHSVSIAELVFCITQALEGSYDCTLCDPDRNSRVSIDELLQAVRAIFNGCG